MLFQVNREIVETMVHCYIKIFGTLKPVFDGRNNLYTRDPLPIGNERVELEVTLPGEGKDRIFRVSIKWVAQVRISFFYKKILCCNFVTILLWVV